MFLDWDSQWPEKQSANGSKINLVWVWPHLYCQFRRVKGYHFYYG